jgi:hypothetical protein
LDDGSNGSKRSSDGDANAKESKREIHVLGIEEIKNDYEISLCRYRLLTKDPKRNEIAASYITPTEVITLLMTNCLFDAAFSLSRRLKLSLRPVFEGLISKYIHFFTMSADGLEESLLDIHSCFGENEMPDVLAKSFDKTPVDKLWLLISFYLEKYECPRQSVLHKCVSEMLLQVGITLPASLRLSYQKRNCPELLWLLMSYSYIEEASNIALDYIDAYLTQGDDFDIKVPLYPNSPAVYIPHNHMQNLLLLLEEDRKSNPEFGKLHEKLRRKLKTFEDAAKQESQIILMGGRS